MPVLPSPATSCPPSTLSPSLIRIGWIGTGVMGLPMAQHLFDNWYTKMTVYNRTLEKAEPLFNAGAVLARSPQEVAVASGVVFTVVGSPGDVRQVYTGPDGVLNSLRVGGIAVDCTTSTPELSKEISSLAERTGKFFVDAPITGGDHGARKGTLISFMGGHAKAIAAVRPLVECYSSKIWEMGAPGSGSMCKLANQVIISANILGMCEGLMFASNAGLDIETFLQAITGGTGDSSVMQHMAPRLLQKNPKKFIKIEHFSKDVRLALDFARERRMTLPSLAYAEQMYMSSEAHGEENMSVQEVIRFYERMNGRTIEKK